MAQTAKDKQSGDAPPPRRGRPDSLGADTAALGRAALARAGFDDPRLILRWDEIAGAETALLARPVRLSGGVLTLLAEPGAAIFLQHEARPLIERINAVLGGGVTRLRFVQAPLVRRPPKPARPAAKGAVPVADPARKYQGPEGLREALLRLARARRPPITTAQD